MAGCAGCPGDALGCEEDEDALGHMQSGSPADLVESGAHQEAGALPRADPGSRAGAFDRAQAQRPLRGDHEQAFAEVEAAPFRARRRTTGS